MMNSNLLIIFTKNLRCVDCMCLISMKNLKLKAQLEMSKKLRHRGPDWSGIFMMKMLF